MSVPVPLPQVYPRVCGGTSRRINLESGGQGLSPRVRGNQIRHQSPPRPAGSIPACAGEPSIIIHLIIGVGVYPRVCGGTVAFSAAARAASGLSPRVRGNLNRNNSQSVRLGSIPACAGEPRALLTPLYRCSVYPRVCGGTLTDQEDDGYDYGLSPRVRGNPVLTDAQIDRVRSIPACAGEPTPRTRTPLCGPVYPRVCGGTQADAFRRQGNDGLSPRVRGNPRDVPLQHHLSGSIPACAGEPVALGTPSAAAGVYPRVCGGTLS